MQGKGTITITTTTTNTAATATMSTPTQLETVAGISQVGNGLIGWTSADNTGDTVTFKYSQPGTGQWFPLTVAGSSGAYQVDLSSLSGQFDFEIDYTASGAVHPYRVAIGTVYITHSTSGTTTDTTLSTLNASATAAAPFELQTVDRWGNVTSFTNEAGQTTNYAYNRYNEMIQETDPSVTATSVKVTDGTAGTTSAATGTASTSTTNPISYNYYDLYGRLIGTKDADGNINGQTYNAANQVISEQHADGGQKTYVYDAFGDQIQVDTYVNSAGTNYKTRNAYDQAGRLTDTEQELVAGTFTTAATGFASDLLAASNANVIRTVYGYDQAGRRITSTDGAGDTTHYAYDLHGNVISTATPLSATTTYGYDLLNHKTSEKDPDANTQSWVYDYFGHLTSHVDLGGTTYTYTYDYSTTNNAGSWLLKTVASSGGQFGGESKTYSYDAANHVTEISDGGINSATFYSYDTAGRIDHEWTIDGQFAPDDTVINYDAMGRISHLSGAGYSVNYSYDLAGNRTQIQAYYSTSTGSPMGTQDLWYGYDAMNRVVISQGVNTSNNVAINANQGTILTYDWRGDRTAAVTEGTYITESGTTYSSATGMTYYTYGYDGAARLQSTYAEAAGGTSAIELESRQYDQASRLKVDTTYSASGGSLSTNVQTDTYNTDGTVKSTATTQNGVNQSAVTSYSYDSAGNLMGYDFTVYNSSGGVAYTGTDAFAYAHGDSYLQTTHTVTNGTGGPENGETINTYNADQQLIQYTDTQDNTKNRYFLNNLQGQALAVVQGSDGNYGSNTAYGANTGANSAFTAALISGQTFFNDTNAQYFFFDPKDDAIGTFGTLNGGPNANFDVNFTPISQEYPAQVPPQYVVEAGDTLAAIAMRAYGDASLWYVIAEANGLTQTGPNASLSAIQGTTLTIPNVVVANHNNAQSFKPFDVSQALGDTTPTQPTPPPPQSNGGGCGGFGLVLIAVVAVIATIYTAGAAAGALGVTTTAAGTTTVAAGSVASTIGVTATEAIAGAVGAVAGSVASQAVGLAIGEQSSFNWDEVASAALTGAFGGALTGAEGAAANTPELQAADAALNSAVGQGVNDALGVQKGFNWAAVAASAAAAPVANAVGQEVGQAAGKELESSALGAFTQKLVTGEINQVAYGLATGGKINYAQITADAFGNAIGDSVATAQNPPQTGTGAQAGGGTGGNQTQSDTDTAAGSSSSAQPAPLTVDIDPATFYQPNLDDLPLPQLPYIVGSEGAQGYWGVAQSILGPGASNADIQNQVLQLMTANPGVTTLHLGDVLNLGNGQISPEAEQTYATMDQSYEAKLVSNEAAARAQLAQAAADQQAQQASLDAFNAQADRTISDIWAAPLPEQYDEYGQPLHGPSNFNRWTTMANVWNPDASFLDNLGAEWHAFNYQVPNPSQKTLDQQALAAQYSQLDQIEASPLGAAFSVIGSLFGASDQTKQGLLNAGQMVEGLGLAVSGVGGRSPAFTGTQNTIGITTEPGAPNSAAPEQLTAGQAFETGQLDLLGLSKNTIIQRPTLDQINSATFQAVVGDAEYTPGGLPVGTIFDSTDNGYLEIKGGTSELNTSYQLRLQTYFSLINSQQYTIQTSRPVNPAFQQYLNFWGGSVAPPAK